MHGAEARAHSEGPQRDNRDNLFPMCFDYPSKTYNVWLFLFDPFEYLEIFRYYKIGIFVHVARVEPVAQRLAFADKGLDPLRMLDPLTKVGRADKGRTRRIRSSFEAIRGAVHSWKDKHPKNKKSKNYKCAHKGPQGRTHMGPFRPHRCFLICFEVSNWMLACYIYSVVFSLNIKPLTYNTPFWIERINSDPS